MRHARPYAALAPTCPAPVFQAPVFLATAFLAVALLAAGTACTSEVDLEPTPLQVTATAGAPGVFAGASVTLQAEADGGTAPIFVRWDRNAGPAEVTFEDETAFETAAGPLTEPGRYVFRALVSDTAGASATAFVEVQVTRPFEAEVPRLVVVGEAATLTASATDDDVPLTFTWSVEQGDATIEQADQPEARLTAARGETVTLRLSASVGDEALPDGALEETFALVAVEDLEPTVDVATSEGTFTLTLDAEAAPLHVANFLQYVDEGFYDGLLFHRNACSETAEGTCEPFVLQGGGYERLDGELVLREPTRGGVESESDNGLSSGDPYTISLALQGSNVDSGMTQFFINLANNAFLDDQGFTVFGRVTEGTGVVDTIAATETTESEIIPGEPSMPVDDITIASMMRGN